MEDEHLFDSLCELYDAARVWCRRDQGLLERMHCRILTARLAHITGGRLDPSALTVEIEVVRAVSRIPNPRVVSIAPLVEHFVWAQRLDVRFEESKARQGFAALHYAEQAAMVNRTTQKKRLTARESRRLVVVKRV